MKAILHIGSEKTGSTSLQGWAAANRDALRRDGVWYCRSLGEINHLGAYLSALPPEVPDEGWRRVGCADLAARVAYQAAIPKALRSEIDAARRSGCHSFVISNEHCQSRLTKTDHVQRLFDLIAPQCDGVRVLCYLRPQIDMAVSLSSTAARTRQRVDRAFFDRINAQMPYYDFHGLFARWGAVFGFDALELVSFKRNPDTVAHFCARLGVEPSRYAPPERKNEKLDIQTIALSNALAQAGQTGAAAQALRLPLNLLSCDAPLQIGVDLAQKVQARFDDGNAQLAQACPDIDLADLTPDWTRYDHPPNLDILDAPCPFADKLAEVLILANARADADALRDSLRAAGQAVRRDQAKIAQKHLTRARALLDALPTSAPALSDLRVSAQQRLDRLTAHPALTKGKGKPESRNR